MFWLALAFYLVAGVADAYTTKRALRDPYRGVRLPLKEGNRMSVWVETKIVRLLLRFWDAKEANHYGFWANMVLTKGGFVALMAILYFQEPTMQAFAVVVTYAFAVLQAIVAYRNRRRIIKARRKVDAAKG